MHLLFSLLNQKTISILAFALLIHSTQSNATNQLTAPKNHLHIELRGKYGTQTTKIYKKNGKWICQTEHFPYFEAAESPIDKINWTKLSSEAKEYSLPCRDKVSIEDKRRKKIKKLLGCREAEQMKKTIEEIDSLCGRY